MDFLSASHSLILLPLEPEVKPDNLSFVLNVLYPINKSVPWKLLHNKEDWKRISKNVY